MEIDIGGRGTITRGLSITRYQAPSFLPFHFTSPLPFPSTPLPTLFPSLYLHFFSLNFSTSFSTSMQNKEYLRNLVLKLSPRSLQYVLQSVRLSTRILALPEGTSYPLNKMEYLLSFQSRLFLRVATVKTKEYSQFVNFTVVINRIFNKIESTVIICIDSDNILFSYHVIKVF